MNLVKRVIPCLDIKNKRVVKGINFKSLKDAGDPVEIANIYNDQGADEIVFLDITASLEKRELILEIIENVAKKIFIPLTVGGGIKNIKDVNKLFNSGADKICVNTSVIYNPSLLLEISKKYGSQCVVVAIDVKKNINNFWEVFSHGGHVPTGINVKKWIKKIIKLGAGELLITSMDRDGTYNGFDISLLSFISKFTTIPVIASGGVGKLQHLVDGIKLGKVDAVLAASIFHYGKFSIQDAKKFLLENNIPVRL
ncbi:imidazole glycerol phosphate synthase subunit HisF [Candidatus Zinderia endosymbiont of Aphrophora alni]|uniref:imidazole glycerol phosphate synthase subunit HisF n=1 Tax=Candidatus Zinderia endosymbiont of Aphrophora alni TaxID=3077951 RepID=UPI0030CFDF44